MAPNYRPGDIRFSVQTIHRFDCHRWDYLIRDGVLTRTVYSRKIRVSPRHAWHHITVDTIPQVPQVAWDREVQQLLRRYPHLTLDLSTPPGA